MSQQQRTTNPNQDEAAKFTSVMLATTEDTWDKLFKQMNKQYTPPKLVMYRGATRTGCGTGQSVMGPFIARQTRLSISTCPSMTI